MVSADLGVIPGSRAPLRFEKTLQHFKARIGLTQCGEDRWRLTVLAQRQKAAITARIGDDFVGFVKGLCDVEGLLRAKAKLFRADFLQGAEIKGQGRHFAHALGFQLDHPCAVCTADRRRCLLRQRLIQAAILIITSVRWCAPLRGKRRAVVQQIHVDCPERYGDEIGDAAVAVDHQSQGRRLYSSYRQHALITRLTAQQGEQPAHVHADQPVRA